MPKYAIDTNLYIDAFRNPDATEQLKQFLTKYLPATYLSSIVMMELRTGAQTKRSSEALELALFSPFEKRRRVFTPSPSAFKEAGRILACMAQDHQLDPGLLKSSIVNDALLAVSCREQGVVLITHDTDFPRIRQHLKSFRYIAHWP